jgi:hypothetical protein
VEIIIEISNFDKHDLQPPYLPSCVRKKDCNGSLAMKAS